MENNNIYQKLLEVQKEIKAIKKTEDNPYFHSKYFDVNAILAELKPILNKHGLILMQPFDIDNGKSVLKTIIKDCGVTISLANIGELGKQGNLDGEIISKIYLPEALDPQKMGSAITYYRRYALQSMFALEAEDDDGNSASGKAPEQKLGKTKPKPQDYDGDEAFATE